MLDQEVDIPTPDGKMNSFVTHPDGAGPYPVVFLYMDAPGKRPELNDMARRLGTAGYYVVVPNLYYRSVREFNVFSGLADQGVEKMFELMFSLNDDLVESDTHALIDFVENDAVADASRLGCFGYCMSGPYAFSMACRFPGRIVAAASIHGVRLFGEGSPAGQAPRARAELYFACAEHDEYAPPEMVNALAAYLSEIGARARVEWYPDTHHGFAFAERGAPVYDKVASERHWERLHDLFDRNLRRYGANLKAQ